MSYAEKYFEIYENLAHLGEKRAEIALGIFQELCKNDRVAEMIKNGMNFSNMGRVNRNLNNNLSNDKASNRQISYPALLA